MKKKTLNLGNLKVQSFITSLENEETIQTIKGGAKRATDIIKSASGICICRTEDCETQVACDVTNTCPPPKTGW